MPSAVAVHAAPPTTLIRTSACTPMRTSMLSRETSYESWSCLSQLVLPLDGGLRSIFTLTSSDMSTPSRNTTSSGASPMPRAIRVGRRQTGRVMWSDHTLFTLDHQSREYVTRPPGHACDEKYLAQQERLQGAVWLWGCFCADGLGHAELYEGTLDARCYQSILALNLVKSAHTFWPRGQWWYQQDNASPHTAGTSRAWFHNHGIDVIDFPPWSSDLNPIELLWNDLKRRVYLHNPKTMEELEHFIAVEWQATELNFCSRTCLNMPQRLQLVRANKGHKIKY
jgi:hypothetical protein